VDLVRDLVSPIPFSTFSRVLLGDHDTMLKYAMLSSSLSSREAMQPAQILVKSDRLRQNYIPITSISYCISTHH